MPTAKVRTGRPQGSRSFEPVVAAALGQVVRQRRIAVGISQDELALIAGLERAHIGRIERGENMPNVSVFMRVADALSQNAGEMLNEVIGLLKGSAGSTLEPAVHE